MHTQSLSRVQLFVAHQASLSMGFPKQEDWIGLPFPFPGDLSNPGIKSTSFATLALTGRFFTHEPPGKPQSNYTPMKKKIKNSITQDKIGILTIMGSRMKRHIVSSWKEF